MINKRSNDYIKSILICGFSLVLVTLIVCACTNKAQMGNMQNTSREMYNMALPLLEDCIKAFIVKNSGHPLLSEFSLTTDSLKMGPYMEIEERQWSLGKWIIDFSEGIETPSASITIVYAGGAWEELILRLGKKDNKYYVIDWETIYEDPEIN